MLAVRGRRTAEVDRAALDALRRPFERVVLDVGTGDGRYAYRLARDNPSWLVIGLDPVAGNLAEVSHRAARKPAKGGLANVLFVQGRAEELPRELDGACDDIRSILPWGRLMTDLIRADERLLASLRRVAAVPAALRFVLNTEIFEDPVPAEARDLPPVTVDYARAEIAPRFAAAGLELDEIRVLGRSEVGALASTWARRLAHGRSPRFVLMAGSVRRPATLGGDGVHAR